MAILVAAFAPSMARAQSSRSLSVSADLDHVELGLFFDVLEDPSATLTLDDVRSAPYSAEFVPADHPDPGYGFTRSAYWTRFTLENATDAVLNAYLDIGYPLIDHVDLYIEQPDGTFEHRFGGDRLPFHERLIHYRKVLFNLRQEANTSLTYYVRFQTSSSMNIGMTLWSVPALSTHIIGEANILGVFHGGMIVILIVNLLLYIGLRDRTWLLFVLFMGAWELAELSLNGLAFQYLWPNQIEWGNSAVPVLVFATVMGMLMYARQYLHAVEHVPKMARAMLIAAGICLAGVFWSFFASYRASIIPATAVAPTFILLIIVAAAMSLTSRPRAAIFFLVAWGSFLVGATLFSLKSFGLVPNTFITHWGMQIGTFTSAIIFSLAMVDQINTIQKEKLVAQEEALASQEYLVQSLRESEAILEEKVNERTKQLAIKNAELEASYDQLGMLSEIGQKITSTLDSEESLNLIYQSISRLMDLSFFSVGVCHHERRIIRFGYIVDKGNRQEPLEISFDDGSYFAPWVIESRREIVMRDQPSEWQDYISEDYAIREDDSRSVILLPMAVEDRVVGVVVVKSEKKDAFSPAHLEMLRTLATYGAISIDNANAYAEIKRAHEDLHNTQAQLIQAEKMASLGQLTAGIAHEIKNPLNFVNNFAKLTLGLVDEMEETAKERKDGEVHYPAEEFDEVVGEVRENAEKIYHHGQRADGIVKSMLLHSRGTSGEKQKTDINRLVGEYVDLAYHGMRATHTKFNAKIDKDLDEAIDKILVAPQDLGRVLVNLFNNALYAIHQRSQTEGDGYVPTLSVSTKGLGGKVRIVVRDNGTGIPDAVKKKIFEPFFTTKPTGEGTGLGLSLCFDIVHQMHGGTLTVDSNENQFTEFTITLPVS